MGCCRAGSPCLTTPRLISNAATRCLRPIFNLCYIKFPRNYTSSPTASYSRRRYNPEHRRQLSSAPDIVRHWVEGDALSTVPPQERFTVVSYNILGDRNMSKHGDLYRNVPSNYLDWNHRKRVICEELLGLNPDIICLQEVDKYYDLLNVLEKAGYLGSHKRRTGGSVDGCAMFWKADKFQLLEGESIEYRQYGLRDNVAQLSVFKMHEAQSGRLVVGNIHVLYNPSRGDVKLGQIRFLSSRAHILSEKWDTAPIVLAGDYNSTPQSPIYKFLSSSELNLMLHNRRELSGQRQCHPSQVLGLGREKGILFVLMDRFLNSSWSEEEMNVATGAPKSHIALHPLKLNSSYAMVKGSQTTRDDNGEPLATSYHSKFLGTVDYLWYSDGLVATKVLDTLPINILKKTGGLPFKRMGSDHLALVSEFAFLEGKIEATEEYAIS
ncbi:carbon catabolite repressor protein 4 homolog 3-like isoform X2 [Nicotiana sylvestris]|uniref:Carbon catabolite repressor protein 4 homolog 3 isoform X2 n=2 Tax=Nicotiana TaxID=4085 RepID=A0A1S4BIM1_TOBAC|nr:PREDICTED: carbon catabolite repressor protein 4 homolog 3-like isoform X2 [Nicotiana sylvestris]XP_016488711.1 PREDICTED: carbon catabolite repressor protein 4 homolog 3-like isoform X2 [Nicotiana tabacum]